MTEPKQSFITFDEAVSLAQNEPDVEFVGMKFDAPFKYLGVYVIVVDSDEPSEVKVMYEGGVLFSSGGEEVFYFLDDVPAEAKNLFYAHKSDPGSGDVQIMGMNSEFVLQEVVPGLSQDARFRDQAHFVQVAGAEFTGYWRQR